MTAATTLRAPAEDDLERLLEINNTAVPAVNALDVASLSALLAKSAFARVADRGQGPVGLLLTFAPDADYDSPNFRWFQARYDDFLYIDRVVVDPRRRGGGIGQSFYRAAIAFAGDRFVRLACEVNERPPNPDSLHFHKRFGFVPVGRQQTEGGAKSVVLMTRGLT